MRSALPAIAVFELKSRMRRISTYVYFLLFLALATLWMAAAGGAFAGATVIVGTDKININSPFVISQMMSVLAFFGVTVIAPVMGRSVQQDFEYQTFHFFFTSPIRKWEYFLGRFSAAVVTLVFIFSAITLGFLLGSHWPGVDASRVGPWSLRALVQPYFTNIIPNVIVLGACFFGLAAVTRRMMPVYVAGILVLVGDLVALGLLRDMENRSVAAFLDPIGSVATGLITRYWSVAEKNTNLVPFTGELLWNRALWLTIGLTVFALCYARFSMAQDPPGLPWRRKKAAKPLAAAPREIQSARPLPQVTMQVGTLDYLRQLPSMIALYTRETVKNVYFIIIVLLGVGFIFLETITIDSVYGTKTYAVTYVVLDTVSGSFFLFMLIVTAFYAGELIWRERDARMAQLTDSLRAPSWLVFAGKLLTLFAVQAVLQVVVMVCGILVQLFHGYTNFELSQYVYSLFGLALPSFWIVACLAFFIHVTVNNKYLGHTLVVIYYIAFAVAAGFGFDHNLYIYGKSPFILYSDMNQYGHFIPAKRWFQAYWGAAAAILLVVSFLLWVRGVDTGWKTRMRLARARFSKPLVATGSVAVLAMIVVGSWIYYNTNVLNHYRTQFAQEELLATYERMYKPLAANPQPKIVGTTVAVDIFPHEHRIRFKGSYKLVNRSDKAIPEIYVNVREELATIRVLKASIDWKETESRPDLAWHRFTLSQPLAPGATMTMDFDLEYAPQGFANAGASSLVVDNGTFLNSYYLPRLGYMDVAELSQDTDRKKHGLAPKDRMPDLDNVAARQRNYISSDGDWIDFDATVSTDADQIGIAPGYLQREWTENGRRYFHYTMDRPILNFFAFLSARYEVKRDVWHPQAENVPIEIYYNKGHEYDLDSMDQSVKDSLDYYTKNFSPYQHHQVRILEFPRYESFAQSFPNTIPFSESIGFIAKVDPKDPKDIDYPYYVTAHEVAHQWWAHQAIGAFVQGATMMSETLAQYSALMVMKHKYGDAKMKRFLRYELDNYLMSRGGERKKELPLYRNENQGYIHYRKGSLVMYELQDVIGEDKVNRALASFLKKVAFQEPPYTISRELLAEFRAVTPEDKQYLITDLFESIVLFENRAIEATARETGPGGWDVTLKVAAKKLRADETGVQNEVPMDDWVDIGVLGADDKTLFLEKRRIKGGESTFTVHVTEKPLKAGIDPIDKLIDRRPDDNVVTVKLEE